MRARSLACAATATLVATLLASAPVSAKELPFDDFIASGTARFDRLIESPVKYTMVLVSKDGAVTKNVRMSGVTNPDGSGILTIDADGTVAVLRCTATTCAKRESGQQDWVTGPNQMDLGTVLNVFTALESSATEADLATASFDITGNRYKADIEGGPLSVVFTPTSMKAALVSKQPTGIVLDMKTTIKRTAPVTVKLPA